MKVWNSGKAVAYNVDFRVPKDYKTCIFRDKTPYEILAPNKNYEEHVIVHNGVDLKFKMIFGKIR